MMGSAPTFSQVVLRYIARRHARAGTTDATLRRYCSMGRFLIKRLGDRPITEYRREELETALSSDESLEEGRRVRWITRRYRARSARAVFHFALVQGLLAIDPAAGIEVEGFDPVRLPVELPLQELSRILAAARADRQHPWLEDSLTLLAITCLRPIELWRMTWSHVELEGIEGSRLLLDGEIRRKNRMPSLYPLAPQAVEILERWRAKTLLVVGRGRLPFSPIIWQVVGDDGRIRPLYTDQVTHIFFRLVREIDARCRRGERPTIYTLRHFYQQLFEGRTSVDVRMRLMGHSSPSTGPRHYMSTMEKEQRNITRAFPHIA